MRRGSTFAAAVLLGFIAALWSWTRPGDAALSLPPGGEAVRVHLMDNGFHTDLAVPRAALTARPGPLGRAVGRLAPGDWVLIGGATRPSMSNRDRSSGGCRTGRAPCSVPATPRC